MPLHRKTLAAAALVLALVGASAGGSARALGAPGGMGHGPMVHLATLEQRARPRRGLHGGKVRAILWRTVRGVHSGAARIRARGAEFRARLAPHDSWARGPPRGLDCVPDLEGGTAKRRPALVSHP
jgi:hypothetical protein